MNPVLLAPAAFKGTLGSSRICRAIASRLGRRGIASTSIPIADGGDGTLDALHVIVRNAQFKRFPATGPDGRIVRARMLVSGRRRFIEMAEAAGLRLMKRLDAWNATTFGVGELIRRCAGAQIVIGIGGSATNDAGAGMLQALGARLLDRRGEPIPRGGGGLGALHRIEWRDRPRFKMTVLTDVDNPLLGPRGATRTFGPQKGADAAMVRRLERNLARFADVVGRDLGVDLRGIEGGGAAGGIGATLVGILGARRARGADYVLRESGFKNKLLRAAALVIGEGRIDATTFQGKAVGEICLYARRAGVPLFVIAGSSDLSAKQIGAEELVSISKVAGGMKEALNDPSRGLTFAAEVLAEKIEEHLMSKSAGSRK